ANLMHYLLMAIVAVTTVAAFEAVGSIIVIAMLIVPPATALLLTNRLPFVLILSAVIGIASAFLGHLGALTVPPLFDLGDTVSSGMMAVAAGLLFCLAWLLAPQQGLLVRWFGRDLGYGEESQDFPEETV
ncbi:MAG: metal ABC transporter permease, partial [Verrucomicrobiota bacterium]|nr:metal ABC transporter permease [Verrucomicrobiota bacterium]